MIHPRVVQQISLLQTQYSALPWYKKLFFPAGLVKAFNQEELDVAEVCYQYQLAWFSRSWFQCLVNFGSSNLTKAYHATLIQDQPQPAPGIWEQIKRRFGVFHRLSNASRLFFEMALSYENPYDYVQSPGNYSSVPLSQEISLSVLVEEKNPSLAISSTMHKKLELEQRIFLEKKTKLQEKINEFCQFIQQELTSFSNGHTLFITHTKECKALEEELNLKDYMAKNAMKYSHVESYSEWETVMEGAWIPYDQHRYFPAQVPRQVWVTKTRSIYVEDEEARKAARYLCADIQLRLQKKESDFLSNPEYQTISQAFSNFGSLSLVKRQVDALIEKITVVSDCNSLTTLLSEFKQMVLSFFSSNPQYPTLRKQDFQPNSDYANYHLAASYVQRIGLFDKNVQRHVAQFMVGQTFPKADEDLIFAEHTPVMTQ